MVLDYAINGDFSQYLKLNSKCLQVIFHFILFLLIIVIIFLIIFIIETLSEKQAKYYVAQIINILAFLRNKSIIHRDLKPANILFDDNWHLILADFGTAKIISNKGSNASSSSIFNKSQDLSQNNSANTTPKNSSPLGLGGFACGNS
jgi:serine/threonine protein kinase